MPGSLRPAPAVLATCLATVCVRVATSHVSPDRPPTNYAKPSSSIGGQPGEAAGRSTAQDLAAVLIHSRRGPSSALRQERIRRTAGLERSAGIVCILTLAGTILSYNTSQLSSTLYHVAIHKRKTLARSQRSAPTGKTSALINKDFTTRHRSQIQVLCS